MIPADKGTHGVTPTLDEKQLWTANVQANTVSVIDLASQKVIRTITHCGPLRIKKPETTRIRDGYFTFFQSRDPPCSKNNGSSPKRVS